MYSCVQGGERGELGTLECIHVYREEKGDSWVH